MHFKNYRAEISNVSLQCLLYAVVTPNHPKSYIPKSV